MVLFVHGGGWHEGDRGAGMHPWLNPHLVAHGFVTGSAARRTGRFRFTMYGRPCAGCGHTRPNTERIPTAWECGVILPERIWRRWPP
jgi:hypothetical protein